MKKFAPLPVLLIIIILLSGCAAIWLGVGAGVGIGTYKYVEGNVIKEYPLVYSRAWDASNEALLNLKMSVTSSNDEGARGQIEAVKQDGSKVVIKIKDKGQNVTSIAVKSGLLGDVVEAEEIHNEIAGVAGL
jgi:hypothetical protein